MISQSKFQKVFCHFSEEMGISKVRLMDFQPDSHAITAMRHAIYANLSEEHTISEVARVSGQGIESIRAAAKAHKNRMKKGLTAQYDDILVRRILIDLGIKVIPPDIDREKWLKRYD